jgi:hypothetical protein
MIARDLNPEDFPLSIYVHVQPGHRPVRGVVWAVTVLRPRPGTRTPLYVPGFAQEYGPVYVTTTFADGAPSTTGPYETPPFGRG